MDSRGILKKCVALLSSTILLSATMVVAAEPRLIISKGQYAVNAENSSVLVDTNDIEANAEAIAGLKQQLGGLSFKYGTEKDVGVSNNDDKGYYWSQDENGNYVKIGAVGNALPSDVLVGKKFSSESGVDINGTMPLPNSAVVAKAVNPSTNLSAGTSATINNSSDTSEAHNTGTSHINLGIGEQITIPHGYYNKDIVIANGVSNKGVLSFSPSNKSTATVQAGYYTGGTLTSDGAYNTGYSQGVTNADARSNPASYNYRSGYNAGYAEGIAKSQSATAKVVYTISHTHGEYCRQQTTYTTNSYTSWENVGEKDNPNYTTVYHMTLTCSVCGRSWDRSSSGGWPSHYATDQYSSHLNAYGKCPYGAYVCGKSAGQQTVNNVSALGMGDTVVSAVVQY